MSTLTTTDTQPASQPSGTIEVTIRHHGAETRIIGAPDGVIKEILAHFTKLYPSLELTSKLILTTDSEEFLQSCTGVLAVAPEGVAVLKNTDRLRDKELLMLHLAGAKLSHLLAKKETDNIALDELTKTTGRSTGTVAGRLSELCGEQLAERVGKGSYRLTTMGARTVVKTLMPKLSSLPEK